jgi:hypothetical protein
MALRKQNAWTAFQLLQVPSPRLMVKNDPQLISLTTTAKAGHQPKDMTKSTAQGIFRAVDGTSQRMLRMMETMPQTSVKVKPPAGQVLLWAKG